MNKERRQRLERIIESLESHRDGLYDILEEEQFAYENLPEAIRESERGEAMSENTSDIEQAASDVGEIINLLQDIVLR